MCWEESNFLTCLAANQSYFLSYLAFPNIGVSSSHFIVIWIKNTPYMHVQKNFHTKYFLNKKTCFLIVREKRRVNDPFEIFMSQNI